MTPAPGDTPQVHVAGTCPSACTEKQDRKQTKLKFHGLASSLAMHAHREANTYLDLSKTCLNRFRDVTTPTVWC